MTNGAGADRFPWPLGLAGGVWLVFGVLLIATSFTARAQSATAGTSVDSVQDTLGDGAVSASASNGFSTLAVILGIGTLCCALALLLRAGWMRHVLVVLGVTGVIVLAVAQRWETLAAMPLLVLGTVPTLLPSVHRYLAGGTGVSLARRPE